MNSDSSSTVILSIASSRSSWVRTAIGKSPSWGSVGMVSGWWSRVGLGLLLGDLLQGVAQVAQRGGEQAGQGAYRRLHPAGQLGQQDLARRQRCESGHVVGADPPV